MDLIVVSHTDADHINGIAEALSLAKDEGISIGAIAMSHNSAVSKAGKELSRLAKENGIKKYLTGKGDSFDIDGMAFKCLYPGKKAEGDPNELSVVLSLEYGSFSALLTGDLESTAEDDVIPELKASGYTVYKAAHHGSRGSSGEDFLKRIRPRITVISCGEDNSYGHPHAEALSRIEQAGSRIFVTTECGSIEIHTDGKVLEVKRYKNEEPITACGNGIRQVGSEVNRDLYEEEGYER